MTRESDTITIISVLQLPLSSYNLRLVASFSLVLWEFTHNQIHGSHRCRPLCWNTVLYSKFEKALILPCFLKLRHLQPLIFFTHWILLKKYTISYFESPQCVKYLYHSPFNLPLSYHIFINSKSKMFFWSLSIFIGLRSLPSYSHIMYNITDW